jgi:outer membrane protein insertion porin family
MSARAENLFGGAERIEGQFEGTRTRNAWQVLFQSPIGAREGVRGEIGIFGIARDQKFFASHELVQRGGHLKITVLPFLLPL